MEQYCLYLRKSRSDIEAENHGEEETLARHEKILLELAKKREYNVTQIYREVVSGETIAARPVMQQLLSEVEHGIWSGVLVVEVERLARGDTIDQGIVAQTFKYSDTQIITPMKTYNPNNEYDEEYFEFGLFMSRREYKTINRRLQRGRLSSVKEGKCVCSIAPYGYDKVKLKGDKGFTLAPNPNEADVIKMIFELYTKGELQPDGTYKRIGVALIARKLNEMKIPARKSEYWVPASIKDMLRNPVYAGKIRWNWRSQNKRMQSGSISISRPRSEEDNCIIVNGLHPALITEETFDLVQEYLAKNPPRPTKRNAPTKNPLAGIVVCAFCGRKLVRRPYTSASCPPTLICSVPHCPNVSSFLHLVEERILKSLEEWLRNYKLQWNLSNNKPSELISESEILRQSLNDINSQTTKLNKQMIKAHELLEQDIYTTEVFLERSRTITERLNQLSYDKAEIEKRLGVETIREKSMKEIIPKVEKLLDVYHELPSAKEKNDMLKDVLEKVVYRKTQNTRWSGSPDDFEITIYPKLPKS